MSNSNDNSNARVYEEIKKLMSIMDTHYQTQLAFFTQLKQEVSQLLVDSQKMREESTRIKSLLDTIDNQNAVPLCYVEY